MRSFSSLWAVSLVMAAGVIGCDGGQPEPAENKDPMAKIAQAPPATGGGAIAAGETVTGELESSDVTLPDGSHIEIWIYSARAGELLTVTMSSSDFDTYLLIGRVVGDGFEFLVEDDDSGDLFNSLISGFEVPADGDYVILANSAGTGSTGAYSLTLESDDGNLYTTRFTETGDPTGRYALLVGISDYPGGEEDDLDAAAPDARLMRDLLVNSYGFPEENVVLLTDDAATRGAIINAFRRHLGQAGPEGVAVFYYSGHGMQLAENVGMADTETDDRDESIVVYGPSDYSSVILDDELGILADELSTDNVLMILDSCHSGTGSRAGSAMPKEVMIEDVEERLRVPKDVMVAETGGMGDFGDALPDPANHILLAASLATETSWAPPLDWWPDRGGTASAFTYFLYAALEEAAESGASFAEVMDRVQREVVDWTGEVDVTVQTPQVEGQRAGESVRSYLVRN